MNAGDREGWSRCTSRTPCWPPDGTVATGHRAIRAFFEKALASRPTFVPGEQRPALVSKDVICVLAAWDAREQALWNRLGQLRLPVPVAPHRARRRTGRPDRPPCGAQATHQCGTGLVDLTGPGPAPDPIRREMP
jgi:hypothetical protein